MRTNQAPRSLKASLSLAASLTALMVAPAAVAQDEEIVDDPLEVDEIVVTGIRRSLQASSDVKRDAQGVVDAITAEDMGKFPDTNLAESLQRITGVSIDRRNGEGSTVTVRGFGPTFNLVLLNGRQMPTAFLEGGAPASRSFDFADIASEGISGVRVYKTGRAALPTGGIGSTLNILTSRPLDAPGLRYTVGAKAVIDNSGTTLDEETSVSPDVSGLYSNTFMDDRIGVTIAGAYQERQSGIAQFGTTSGWRGAYRGDYFVPGADDNQWGALPASGEGVTNLPEPDEVYSVPQNGNYSLTQIERERINGQLALQYRPVDSVTATLDYFYSQNKLQTERQDMSVWFNHGNTTSAFEDGAIADILFYSESFDPFTDLSMGASRLATKSEKHSIGGNVVWEATDNFQVLLDAHSSSAESGSDGPYGSNGVLSTADLALNFQSLDFRPELPTLALGWNDPFTDINPNRMIATGSTFQDNFIRTEIDQVRLEATYEFDAGIVQSVDFGVSATRNDYRATFSNNQRDTWGGIGTPEDYPDDIWHRVDLASNFDEFDGYQETFQDFLVFDFDRLVALLDDDDFSGNDTLPQFDADGNPIDNSICGGDGVCIDGPVNVDQRTEEESLAAYFEVATAFDMGIVPATLVGGLRYERTDVTSQGLSRIPINTVSVSANESVLVFQGDSEFIEDEGEYDYWLPAVDFQLEPDDGWVLRASYSHTLTRPSYSDISAGIGLVDIVRIDGGVASAGNPQLEPFLSKNFDLSAEYYYDEGSYISVGYFDKKVENFTLRRTAEGAELFPGVPTFFGGDRFNEAVEALGTEDINAIRQFIFENFEGEEGVEVFRNDVGEITGGNIFGVPGDDPTVGFRFTQPFNNDETKNVDGWEFAWQHVLGDTGFGAIFNFTVVNGDTEFNNLSVPPASAAQTPLPGLSDSFNVVGFYDKDGIQVRAAYNWRDQFLTSRTGTSGVEGNPLYVESYGQLDVNASYEFTANLSAFVEGINVLDETVRTVGRSDAYVNFATQTGSRYNVGVRYRF